MNEQPAPLDRVRPLLRVRQIREFTDQPASPAELTAIADVARWSGSSSNRQPWRFVVVRDVATLRRLHEAGLPQTRALATATGAIVTVLPNEPDRMESFAFDDGRAAERMLIAATFLDLGGAIQWVRPDVRPAIREILGLPTDRFARTIVAVGHPTPDARRPKSAPGTARLPRDQVVFEERWPAG